MPNTSKKKRSTAKAGSPSLVQVKATQEEWLWRLRQLQDSLPRLIPRNDVLVTFALREAAKNRKKAATPAHSPLPPEADTERDWPMISNWPCGELLCYRRASAIGLKAASGESGFQPEGFPDTVAYWCRNGELSMENINMGDLRAVKSELVCFYYVKSRENLDRSECIALEKGSCEVSKVLLNLIDTMPHTLREPWGALLGINDLADVLLWLAAEKEHRLLTAFVTKGWPSLKRQKFAAKALFVHIEPDLRTAADYAITTLRDLGRIYGHSDRELGDVEMPVQPGGNFEKDTAMTQSFPEWMTGLASDVAGLIREYDAMSDFRTMIRQWAARGRHCNDAKRQKQRKRAEHFQHLATLPDDDPLRMEGEQPPRPGWKYDMDFVAEQVPMKEFERPDGSGTFMAAEQMPRFSQVSGWVPPELSETASLGEVLILPLAERVPELDEKYTLLAAIHDAALSAVPKINPWETEEAKDEPTFRESMAYYLYTRPELLLPNVRDHKAELGIFLDDVAADLRAQHLDARPGSGGQKVTMQQPWNDDDPEYLFLTEALKLIDGRVALSTLSKLCKPHGEMRYMRKKGVGCKVHIADFRQYMRGRQSDPKWAAVYMNWLNGQKAGRSRVFWHCRACGHEYAEDANATDRCPKCKEEAELTPKAPPKPRR